MFDRIAGRYDLLNRLISFRLDAYWRNQAIRAAVTGTHPHILDLGTGTGDLALNAARRTRGNGRIVGLDFSLRMLRLAQAKRAKALGVNPLDEIAGIGQSRKRALLTHFGSAKAVSRAGIEDLKAVGGISADMARKIYDFFHESAARA